MAIRFKKSLRRRFISTLVAVVTVILVIFSGVVIGYNYTKKEAELQKHLQQTLKLAETALPEAVWQVNQQSINNILRAILTNNAVVYARIVIGDQGDRVVISQIKPAYEEIASAEFNKSANYLLSDADVFRKGVLIGKLQVVMSRQEIYSEILATAFSVISLFIMLIAAILFSSMLILRHFIFKPLAKLERSANLIAAGNLDTHVDVDRSDEIGSLASAFKLMAKRLEASFENLEHKVIERTVDVSQAKIAAEKISQNLLLVSAELQALLDNSPVGILFIDSHRVIKRVNAEMEKIIGYSSVELVGRTTSTLYATQDADSPAGASTFENSLHQLMKNGLCERRTTLMRKDGSEITCRLRGRSIPVSNDLEGVIWSVEDITSRIHMEQELLKAQKQESVGVLAGGIAHDFNNILFAVIGNLSLAERLVGETGSAREYIQAAQKASMRAKELTAKLLTFASGGDPVKATASLPDLVKDAVGFVLSGSNVKCDYQIPVDLWSVSMDKDQIRQVIHDLVRNANQSMPEGGTILISFANMKLEDNEVVGLYPGRYVRVCLTDRGRGIEGENLERVFDPYFSTKEKDSNKGSGLGLAIVHSIVNRHDGRISVDSIPGKGTTFTLYLPARLVESFELPRRSAIIPSGKGIVLVLDDDQDIQEIVGEMLLHIGYKAQPAFNGREAVKLYRDFYEAGNTRFCAVIMDLNTQGELVGREVLSGLLEIDPGARVIASCEDSADPIVDNYLAYGFCSLIVKPYKLLELNGLMSSVCNIKSSTDSARQKISSLKN
jgi:PAS domain S-box-containing protein